MHSFRPVLFALVFLEMLLIIILSVSLFHKVNVPPNKEDISCYYRFDGYLGPSENHLLLFEYEKNFSSPCLNTNSYGFLFDESLLKKDDFRILVVGDSVAAGFLSNKSFSGQLQDCLDEKSIPASVLNMGVEGYNTFQELKLLENYNTLFKPDFVIVQYSLNDLEFFHLDELLSESQKQEFLSSLSQIIGCNAGYGFEPGELDFDVKKYGEECHLQLLNYSFAGIRKLSVNSSFGVLAVIFPYRTSLYPDYNLSVISGKVGSLAAQNSLEYMDLYPFFANSTLDLFSDNIHPNEEGHEVAAEALCDYFGKII